MQRKGDIRPRGEVSLVRQRWIPCGVLDVGGREVGWKTRTKQRRNVVVGAWPRRDGRKETERKKSSRANTRHSHGKMPCQEMNVQIERNERGPSMLLQTQCQRIRQRQHNEMSSMSFVALNRSPRKGNRCIHANGRSRHVRNLRHSSVVEWRCMDRMAQLGKETVGWSEPHQPHSYRRKKGGIQYPCIPQKGGHSGVEDTSATMGLVEKSFQNFVRLRHRKSAFTFEEGKGRGNRRSWATLQSRQAMVEGHGVHRVAARHRKSMVGKLVDATSPNGRVDASKIHGSRVVGVEAIGKNLFYTFQNDAGLTTVMHIHFGMAGRFTIGKAPGPEPRSTTRIQLVTREETPLVAQLTAMTCVLGGEELYKEKKERLGPDPLRHDADKEIFWSFIQRRPKRSIGYLLMDQAAIAGVGNIYRSEILFCAGIHPDKKAADITRAEFESLWYYSVELLQRGFQSGYIITINPEEAAGPLAALKGGEKRYVYNRETCKRCHKPVLSWSISNRTVYACESCQQSDETAQFPAAIARRENDPHNTAAWLLGENKAGAGLLKGRTRKRAKRQEFEPNSVVTGDRTLPTARTRQMNRLKDMDARSNQKEQLKQNGRLGFRERKMKQSGAARKVQHVISAK